MPATYHKYSWFVYLHVKFFFLLLLQQDFSRPTSKDESLKFFFAADGGCSSLSLFLSCSENWIFSKAELAAATACQRSCCCRRRGCRLTSRLGSFSATTAHPPSRSRLTRRRRLRTPAHNAHTTPEGVSVFQKQNTSGAKMKHYLHEPSPNFTCIFQLLLLFDSNSLILHWI